MCSLTVCCWGNCSECPNAGNLQLLTKTQPIYCIGWERISSPLATDWVVLIILVNCSLVIGHCSLLSNPNNNWSHRVCYSIGLNDMLIKFSMPYEYVWTSEPWFQFCFFFLSPFFAFLYFLKFICCRLHAKNWKRQKWKSTVQLA